MPGPKGLHSETLLFGDFSPLVFIFEEGGMLERQLRGLGCVFALPEALSLDYEHPCEQLSTASKLRQGSNSSASTSAFIQAHMSTHTHTLKNIQRLER